MIWRYFPSFAAAAYQILTSSVYDVLYTLRTDRGLSGTRPENTDQGPGGGSSIIMRRRGNSVPNFRQTVHREAFCTVADSECPQSQGGQFCTVLTTFPRTSPL